LREEGLTRSLVQCTTRLPGIAIKLFHGTGDELMIAHRMSVTSRRFRRQRTRYTFNAFAKWTDEQRAALVERKKTEQRAKEKGGMTDAQVDEWCEKLFRGFYVPHVIEPSAGLDRLALAVLSNAYTEVEKTDAKGKTETLYVMRFHPRLAPVKVGVFPLLKNKPELVAKAREVFELLRKHLSAFYDEGGSIGKRYARQDEAGTPFCMTIDF